MSKQDMIEEIQKVLEAKAPSMTFMSKEEVKALYDEHVVEYDMDVVYEEVIKGFFGLTTKGIKSGDVVVTKESLKELYKPLKLKGKVFREVLKAHDTVLTYGHATGNERVIVIDRDSGDVIDDRVGTPTNVGFYVPPLYKGKVITLHNHPSSSSFSPKDVSTLNDIRQIECSVIQGHDGSLYYLRKRDFRKNDFTEKRCQETFDVILARPENKSLPFRHKLEVFVRHTATVLNLEYKGDKQYDEAKRIL